ncbi:hypothetical protein B0H14DRAFT_2699347 [Mycena olivaceomarginata]|nr:hypothetical protein B0H14DRAFT_2699347 [Mycena olivaceomarginata]
MAAWSTLAVVTTVNIVLSTLIQYVSAIHTFVLVLKIGGLTARHTTTVPVCCGVLQDRSLHCKLDHVAELVDLVRCAAARMHGVHAQRTCEGVAAAESLT